MPPCDKTPCGKWSPQCRWTVEWFQMVNLLRNCEPFGKYYQIKKDSYDKFEGKPFLLNVSMITFLSCCNPWIKWRVFYEVIFKCMTVLECTGVKNTKCEPENKRCTQDVDSEHYSVE